MFPKIGGGFPPKWMVKIMENPIKMDDLGVPLFLVQHPNRPLEKEIPNLETTIFEGRTCSFLGSVLLDHWSPFGLFFVRVLRDFPRQEWGVWHI